MKQDEYRALWRDEMLRPTFRPIGQGQTVTGEAAVRPPWFRWRQVAAWREKARRDRQEKHEILDDALARGLAEATPDSDGDPAARIEAEEARESLDQIMRTLTYRERTVLKCRADGYTLLEAGRIFRVTREGLRQIEAKAIRKLQHPTRMGWLAKVLGLDQGDDMQELLEYYRLSVEEQLYGNYAVSERRALAICKHRDTTIRVRHRRGLSARDAAAQIATIERLDALPMNWKPPARG